MEKRWNVKEQAPEDKVLKLVEAIRVSPVIANLLVQRGVETYDQAKEFFRPDLKSLHDPFQMKDMDKAVKRIADAAINHEKILVYGDYDVDGTSSVALVYTFLKFLALNCGYYIPDRYAEGYGISFKGVDYAAENGYKLIVALDCGIKAHDKVSYATEKGIEFIICDHHKPDKTLPEAVAILNPKRTDCEYPYKELPGCGIGFKLIQALAINYDMPFDMLEQYLDLVGLSIASDIVPITGENRTLTFHGLKRINSAPRAGFKAIIDLVQLQKQITVNDLVFVFGPRINSAGRIETGKNAVELLIADNPEKAKFSSDSVNKTNFERRDVDTMITQEAINMLEADHSLKKKKTTVLYNPEWHKGVIGIVASRLIEKHYYRPTIILTKSNGKITGSARSVRDFDLYEAIDACSHLLEQFGGHKYAAGLTMAEENLPAFIALFEKVVSESIPEELLRPVIEIDAPLPLSSINDGFYKILKQLAPFGPGNMAPVFYSDNVITKYEPKVVGSNHLRMNVMQADNPNTSFNVIGFDMGEHLKIVASGKPFRISYSLRENEWNGTTSIELNLKDVKA